MEKFPCEKIPKKLWKQLYLRYKVHKTIDQEAGRAQIFSTGYLIGDFDQYFEHGNRIS